MSIFSDLGFPEDFGSTLDANDLESLKSIHGKYAEWSAQHNHEDISSYLRQKVATAKAEAADCERVRSKFK